MRYPVDNWSKWYNAQPFGTPTSYGYHEGDDLNLSTGGDTDLGQPLYAVAMGKIVYFHNNSHPTTGFGRHMVLQVETSIGRRWYHYAHCDSITAETKEVPEGTKIGVLGKSGTTSAHLHFAVFKVDPSTLYNGIDSIAKTTTNLNAWWEKFKLLDSPVPVPPEGDMSQLLTFLGVTSETDAIKKIAEHLGPDQNTVTDVSRCEWGDETKNGGYLGSARRRIKELEAQPIPTPDPSQPPVVPGWEPNGLQVTVGDKTWNYYQD